MRRNRRVTTDSTHRDVLAETRRDQAVPGFDARQVAQQARKRWQQGELHDVSAILKSYPQLHEYRTIVIELAYEEYLNHQKSGESLDMREFANRFPGYEMSLFAFLHVQSVLGNAEMLEEDLWPKPNDTFLGFRIIDELGRGAFARVYLATEDDLGDRPVVVKVAPHGNMEATTLGRLNHPHIVPVYSIRQDPESGLTAICMPYLGRATLMDLLDQGFSGGKKPHDAESSFGKVHPHSDEHLDLSPARFSRAKGSYEDQVTRLGIQLADALDHSHCRGIFHRDIKPSNVLLASDGRPLLFDFNLSVGERSWLDRVGGTLPYMAPEDLVIVLADDGEKKPVQADPRSDIFSLGVILYQLLAGKLPFEPESWNSSTSTVAANILSCQQEKPESIRRINSGVTVELEEIILDCLSFKTDQRIQKASELADRLRRYFRPVPRVKRWIWRHPRRVSTATALMALFLASWGTWLALRPPYSERMLAQGSVHYENAEYDNALNCLNESLRYDRDCVDALIVRGKTHLARDDYNSAFTDFNDAQKIDSSPITYSACGYCQARLRNHTVASAMCALAYDQGDRSLALLNNMGYCLYQQNKLPEAERFLQRALELDSAHPVVCHNLFFVHLKRCVRDNAVSAEALAAADRAAKYGQPSLELYRELAVFYAIASRTNTSHVSQSLHYLKLSVEKGLDSSRASSPTLSALTELPEYQALVAQAETKAKSLPTSPPPDRLVSPF